VTDLIYSFKSSNLPRAVAHTQIRGILTASQTPQTSFWAPTQCSYQRLQDSAVMDVWSALSQQQLGYLFNILSLPRSAVKWRSHCSHVPLHLIPC